MRVLRDLNSLQKLLDKRGEKKDKIRDKVAKIIEMVASKGDDALVEYTKKFDKVKLDSKKLKVTEAEISSAFNELNSELISAIKSSMDNVYKFYRQHIPKSVVIRENNGKVLKTRYTPVERVGVYVPAGTAPLVSSVYMSVIPAIVAGVKDIILVSPPDKNGQINPFILTVASMLKIKEIYKVGGAQAVAALAYGTKTIKKVDKIVGPGNDYVTEAKRQVFGKVDIDMLAGPSEVAIIAGKKANSEYIISDLEAQIEHRGGMGIVITNSKRVINDLRKAKVAGFIIKVRNLDQAVDVANRIAPEHLEICTQKPASLVKNIKHAGAVFLGEYTPVALGDYTAGPSHVLPTASSARFFSALSTRDFLKEIHIISYTKKALSEEFSALEKITALEGMVKHFESVKKRVG